MTLFLPLSAHCSRSTASPFIASHSPNATSCSNGKRLIRAAGGDGAEAGWTGGACFTCADFLFSPARFRCWMINFMRVIFLPSLMVSSLNERSHSLSFASISFNAWLITLFLLSRNSMWLPVYIQTIFRNSSKSKSLSLIFWHCFKSLYIRIVYILSNFLIILR